MSKYLTKSVAATISALLLLGCAAPAFAADATVEKKETSYLILNADGSVQEQVTSDWLHSDDGFDAVTDESDLSDIQNLKSDVMPEQSGNTLKWTTDETDIYYQGKNSAQAPVGVSIEYTLGGKAVTADELKGQSGHLVATVKLTNNTGEEVTVNGKKRTVYTPFFTVAAAVLPSENFKNITTEHGLVESDSKTQVACYLAMPGMKEAVSDLLPDSFYKLDDLMLDTLTLEADVTDCTVPTFLFAAAPNLSDLDLDEVSDELGDTMDELTDAIDQLKDGSGALDDAVGTLVESLDTFASSYGQFDAGVDSALNGTQTLANGTENLLENAQLLATKTGELSLGAIQLQNSTAQLAGVMNQPKLSEEAAFIAALMPSTVTSAPLTTAVRMVVEPVGTGTRCAEPISLPFSSGITRPIAFAAPVEFGTMLAAPARARRRSPFLCGPSRIIWSPV